MNRALIAIAFLWPAAEPALAEPLTPVGLARVDITPDTPIRLCGYATRRQESTGVAQKIWAKAIAIGSDSSCAAVLITLDAIGIPAAVTEEVARRLGKKAGVTRPCLAICASHTHVGPCIQGVLPNIFGEPIPPEHLRIIERYTHKLTDCLEQVALQALAARRPGRLAWSQGQAKFAVNRRVVKDGLVRIGVNPAGPVDHALPLLVITDEDGKLRGIWVNYACHCTTLVGEFNEVHGDWAGVAQEMIEARHPGIIALTSIGCGGDANPQPRGRSEDVKRHGEAVADEVDRLLKGPTRQLTGAPVGRLQRIDLPLDPLPSRQEWEQRAQRRDRTGYYARLVLARLDHGQSLPAKVPYVVQTWTFGDDLALVFLAGEVVVDYSLRLKKELDGRRLWVNAYSNDLPCYIASKRVRAEGGYEAKESMNSYDRPSSLAPETEDIIIQTVKQLLPPSFAAPGRSE